MKHARQTIREAVSAALSGITGVTHHRSRVYPKIELPAISVFGNEETSGSENELINATRRYSRQLSVVVEITDQAVTGVDDEVDDYAAQVEAALEVDRTLGGTVTDLELVRTSMSLDGSGDKPQAVARLTYNIWYRNVATDPENVI